jgi:hypothetical protein
MQRCDHTPGIGFEMPDNITVDTSNFDWLPQLFERRQSFVLDAAQEASQRADAYASFGGRRHRIKARRFYRGQRRPFRGQRRATGRQKASMMEHVCYHRFVDWWGNW